MPILSLAPMLLQAVRGAIPSSPIDLVLSATTVTQVVLIILAVLSLLSWSIMFGLWRSVGKAMRAADQFMRTTSRSSVASTRRPCSRSAHRSGALPRLYMRAMRFVADARVASQQVRERATATGGECAGSGDAERLTDRDAPSRCSIPTRRTSAIELARFLPWLATIGSVSPLIGLLGTVLGVIEAFLGIASKGSGNLSAVAPGVGEALTATAAALAVAIPATFGYNIFASRVNRFDGKMESFGTAVIALLVREGRI